MSDGYIQSAVKMNQVLSRIFSAIEESKEEVFEITDNLNKECSRLEAKLEDVNQQIQSVILELDKLEQLEKKSRRALVEVSRDFSRHSEAKIRDAYERANDLQVKLILKHKEEEKLSNERKEIEAHLRSARRNLEKAEKLTTKFSVALEFLEGNMEDFSNTITDLEQRHLMGRKIIQVQEEERKRVSREIHDGPAQSFSNILLKIEYCEKLMDKDIEKAKTEAQVLKDLVRGSTREIRKIIYNLRPMAIDDLGIVPTLRRYLEDFQSETGIEITFHCSPDFNMEDSVLQLALFRIAQEALNNITKHAQAEKVDIILDQEHKFVTMAIKDNGIGFDTQNIRRSVDNGFGIVNMKERAELLNGNLKVQSEPGKGTTLLIKIPTDKQEEETDGKNQSIDSR
ncbi:MAG: sensor histidine kinase [Tindallia sp. MSAO_Bac2]|nr:MAG: sensor histidine kinase [Tindallia sp. MSAO_Bac2]